MTERRAFGPVTDEDNRAINIQGKLIYLHLRHRFGLRDDQACDLIMNSLVAGLVNFIEEAVAEDNRAVILQIIHKTLTKNLINND